MAVDMYDTRTMTRALEQMKPVRTFLRDTIFGDTENHVSRYVDIDIQKGNRRIAAYVSPKLEGKVVRREGFETKTYEAPYTKEKMITSATELQNRPMGMDMYAGAMTPGEAAQRQLGKDLRTLDERIIRLEEVQSSEAIQTGKVTVSGEGIDFVVDFGMSGTHLPTLLLTARWSDLANSDPLGNLRDWSDIVSQDSGMVPRDIIVGKDAMRNFVRNTSVQAILNNRRITMGDIKPELLPAGVRYWGYLDEVGLDVWEYTEWYYDVGTSSELPMIDPDKVVMWARGARATRHYGAVQDLKAGINFVGARFAKSWEEEDPSARFVMVQSAPLVAPHQIDGFLCATVQ
jgi:major capsid protein E